MRIFRHLELFSQTRPQTYVTLLLHSDWQSLCRIAQHLHKIACLSILAPPCSRSGELVACRWQTATSIENEW